MRVVIAGKIAGAAPSGSTPQKDEDRQRRYKVAALKPKGAAARVDEPWGRNIAYPHIQA
jgi:hypothetical protein